MLTVPHINNVWCIISYLKSQMTPSAVGPCNSFAFTLLVKNRRQGSPQGGNNRSVVPGQGGKGAQNWVLLITQ